MLMSIKLTILVLLWWFSLLLFYALVLRAGNFTCPLFYALLRRARSYFGKSYVLASLKGFCKRLFKLSKLLWVFPLRLTWYCFIFVGWSVATLDSINLLAYLMYSNNLIYSLLYKGGVDVMFYVVYILYTLGFKLSLKYFNNWVYQKVLKDIRKTFPYLSMAVCLHSLMQAAKIIFIVILVARAVVMLCLGILMLTHAIKNFCPVVFAAGPELTRSVSSPSLTLYATDYVASRNQTRESLTATFRNDYLQKCRVRNFHEANQTFFKLKEFNRIFDIYAVTETTQKNFWLINIESSAYLNSAQKLDVFHSDTFPYDPEAAQKNKRFFEFSRTKPRYYLSDFDKKINQIYNNFFGYIVHKRGAFFDAHQLFSYDSVQQDMPRYYQIVLIQVKDSSIFCKFLTPLNKEKELFDISVNLRGNTRSPVKDLSLDRINLIFDVVDGHIKVSMKIVILKDWGKFLGFSDETRLFTQKLNEYSKANVDKTDDDFNPFFHAVRCAFWPQSSKDLSLFSNDTSRLVLSANDESIFRIAKNSRCIVRDSYLELNKFVQFTTPGANYQEKRAHCFDEISSKMEILIDDLTLSVFNFEEEYKDVIEVINREYTGPNVISLLNKRFGFQTSFINLCMTKFAFYNMHLVLSFAQFLTQPFPGELLPEHLAFKSRCYLLQAIPAELGIDLENFKNLTRVGNNEGVQCRLTPTKNDPLVTLLNLFKV